MKWSDKPSAAGKDAMVKQKGDYRANPLLVCYWDYSSLKPGQVSIEARHHQKLSKDTNKQQTSNRQGSVGTQSATRTVSPWLAAVAQCVTPNKCRGRDLCENSY